jgi:hypothetical protein
LRANEVDEFVHIDGAALQAIGSVDEVGVCKEFRALLLMRALDSEESAFSLEMHPEVCERHGLAVLCAFEECAASCALFIGQPSLRSRIYCQRDIANKTLGGVLLLAVPAFSEPALRAPE